MKHNVYDFDKTIYRKDSTFDFYRFCLKRNPVILIEIPVLMVWSVLYLLRICTITEFKEKFFRFLRYLDSADELAAEFWEANFNGIADFYRVNHRDSDIVISASPEFLLKPVCGRLNVEKLIASRVDQHTGRYTGENCRGEEKLRRFREELAGHSIEEFYSDSLSDAPLAGIAEKAYLVRKSGIVFWPDQDRSKAK